MLGFIRLAWISNLKKKVSACLMWIIIKFLIKFYRIWLTCPLHMTYIFISTLTRLLSLVSTAWICIVFTVTCPEGTYIAGSTTCALCPAGTFNPGTGQTQCTTCSGGTSTYSEGNVFSNACQGIWFSYHSLYSYACNVSHLEMVK
jgi:hypothetical protein